MDSVAEFRKHALNPEHPRTRGSHENGDIFFQHREACNPFYDALPAVVEKYMGKVNEKLGTNYQLFNYYGAPDADRVIIAMARIQKMVADDTKTTADPQKDVNVVYVQLESFIDPAEIKSLKLSEDAVPNWTELSKNFTTGYLQVPVVGAGTANTECEVLTGMSTRMWRSIRRKSSTCASWRRM